MKKTPNGASFTLALRGLSSFGFTELTVLYPRVYPLVKTKLVWF